MLTLLQRNRGIEARLKDLSPLKHKLEQLFIAGKREQLKEGRDVRGMAFQPLAHSTLERPRVSTTPFLKDGDSSSILVRYEVEAKFAAASITITAGWPMQWVRYHVAGGPKLPRRDPTGFRDQDKRRAMAMVREYVMTGRI